MSNDNKEYKNSEPCKEKQEACELTPEELEGVSGGDIGQYNNNTALPSKPGEVTNDPKEFLTPFDYKR